MLQSLRQSHDFSTLQVFSGSAKAKRFRVVFSTSSSFSCLTKFKKASGGYCIQDLSSFLLVLK